MARNSSFYYAFLVLPADRRRAILAVFDFCRAVDDGVDLAANPAAAVAAVSQWRAEVAAIFDGRQPPSTREGLALRAAVSAFGIERAPFDALVDGVSMDIEPRRYDTFADLEQYCHRVASAVGLMCLPIFGDTDAASRAYARDLGVALQLTNILRDVASDFQRGRVYLPVEDFERFGCRIDDLAAAVGRRGFGAESARLQSMLEHNAARARVYFSRAARLLPGAHARGLLPAEIMRAIYRNLLAEIEARRCDVFRERVRVSKPRQARIVLATWWAIRRGRVPR